MPSGIAAHPGDHESHVNDPILNMVLIFITLYLSMVSGNMNLFQLQEGLDTKFRS